MSGWWKYETLGGGRVYEDVMSDGESGDCGDLLVDLRLVGDGDEDEDEEVGDESRKVLGVVVGYDVPMESGQC